VQWPGEPGEGMRRAASTRAEMEGSEKDRARYRAWAARDSEPSARCSGGATRTRSPSPAAPKAKAKAQATKTRGTITHWKQRLAAHSLTGDEHFDAVVGWAAIMVATCLCAELTASTQYGKFADGAMVTIPARLGWWLLELPVTITFLYFFFGKGGPQSQQTVPRLMAGVMCWHYSYRGWLFPFLMTPHRESQFDLVPALGGALVTVTHGCESHPCSLVSAVIV